MIYLLLSIVRTLSTPNLMLTLINTAYYGVTQFFPGVVVILLRLKVRPMAVGLGIVFGQVSAIAMYVVQPDFAGVNLGLVSLAINLVVLFAVNWMLPRPVAQIKTA